MHAHAQRVDIFSYGVVLCELLSRQQPAFKVFGRQPPHFGIDPNEIRCVYTPALDPFSLSAVQGR